MTLEELLARWNTSEGRPFKGSLIDIDAYEAAPSNIGCMCAQGQALHLLGGWSAEKLRDASQETADAETTKLLNISRAHAVLLRQVNDSADGAPGIVLTDPSRVLGGQWSKVLDFWWHLDNMTPAARDAARDAAGAAAWAAAWAAALSAGAAARDAAGAAAWAAALSAGAAQEASSEIQGAAVMREKGQPFYFLPLFGFASPDEIPARPADYGITPDPEDFPAMKGGDA